MHVPLNRDGFSQKRELRPPLQWERELRPPLSGERLADRLAGLLVAFGEERELCSNSKRALAAVMRYCY
jgi:hypothetical protein